MAVAYVEYGRAASPVSDGSSIHAACVFSEPLAISGSTVTSASAFTAAQALNAGNAGGVARIVTDDTACFFAVGITPDPTATVAVFTASGMTTSARRYIPAGGWFDVALPVGAKIAVRAVA